MPAPPDNPRVVVVTGAGGSGCGLATRFANAGAAVVVCDIDEIGGREAVREIEASGAVPRSSAQTCAEKT